jgi:hypothetical protein
MKKGGPFGPPEKVPVRRAVGLRPCDDGGE